MEERDINLEKLAKTVPFNDVDMDEIILDMDETKEGLQQIIDELRVQWKLANMEGQDKKTAAIHAIHILKQDFDELEKKLQARVEEVQVQGHLGLMEAKQRWKQVKLNMLEEWYKAKGEMINDKLRAELLADIEEAKKAFMDIGEDDGGDKMNKITKATKALRKSVADTIKIFK